MLAWSFLTFGSLLLHIGQRCLCDTRKASRNLYDYTNLSFLEGITILRIGRRFVDMDRAHYPGNVDSILYLYQSCIKWNKCTLTTRPASLLCKFTVARKSLPLSRLSTNFLPILYPNLTLSWQPSYSQPSLVNLCLLVETHWQPFNEPSEHARVRAYDTPAAVIAYANAVSLQAE